VRVLVVDDHEMVAKSLIRLLGEDPTISIIGAESTGQAGIARALQDHADIVVMDFQLPDMDGAAATRALLRQAAEIKVIGLSGSDRVGAYRAAMEAGCSAWIRKTSAVDELLEAVHRVQLGQPVKSRELDDLPRLEDLVVHYQPIVELKSERVVGFEALVRWNHPFRGILLPSHFLRQAEQTGHILEIGRVVAHQAAKQLASWQRMFPGHPFFMSINMSAPGLSEPWIVEAMTRVIETSGIDPADFVIEITETVLVDDTPATRQNAERLKALGIGLALDDFGTAFSSLSYLRQFPFDYLKIDNDFTADLPDLPRSVLLVEVVKQVADHLGLKAIAEGIERRDQAQCLIEAGWELGQGFLYSRPVDPASIPALLRRSATSSS
jgi:EAL domain-containing protein (putative c-di-GMP-specific phosphodiesterase class I)